MRGRTAVLSPGLVSAPALAGTTLDPATDRYLQWEEPTGELVLLAGVGVIETELLGTQQQDGSFVCDITT